jgi:biopolymer transport protein ExbB
MIDLFMAGGWLMFPLLGCSILALTIIVERLWVLRENKIIPLNIVPEILKSLSLPNATPLRLTILASSSPLGLILSSGLQSMEQGVSAMRVRMEEQGRQVIAELERYLNTLGTLASIAPLLGLLGTVLGMIEIFAVLDNTSPETYAMGEGIAKALLTTAFGLFIAIPCLMFHRYFRRRIDEFSLKLEKESQRLMFGLKSIVPTSAMRRLDRSDI